MSLCEQHEAVYQSLKPRRCLGDWCTARLAITTAEVPPFMKVRNIRRAVSKGLCQ